MKKKISVLFALIMLVTCFAMPVSASANGGTHDDHNCVAIDDVDWDSVEIGDVIELSDGSHFIYNGEAPTPRGPMYCFCPWPDYFYGDLVEHFPYTGMGYCGTTITPTVICLNCDMLVRLGPSRPGDNIYGCYNHG